MNNWYNRAVNLEAKLALLPHGKRAEAVTQFSQECDQAESVTRRELTALRFINRLSEEEKEFERKLVGFNSLTVLEISQIHSLDKEQSYDAVDQSISGALTFRDLVRIKEQLKSLQLPTRFHSQETDVFLASLREAANIFECDPDDFQLSDTDQADGCILVAGEIKIGLAVYPNQQNSLLRNFPKPEASLVAGLAFDLFVLAVKTKRQRRNLETFIGKQMKDRVKGFYVCENSESELDRLAFEVFQIIHRQNPQLLSKVETSYGTSRKLKPPSL